MTEQFENQPTFDPDECATFITDKLISMGIATTEENVKLILDLEFEYMQYKGLAV